MEKNPSPRGSGNDGRKALSLFQAPMYGWPAITIIIQINSLTQ